MSVTDFVTLGLLGCILSLVAIVSDWGDDALQRAIRR